MARISSEDMMRARQVDLVTYLQLHEPHQLVKVCADTYCTREHDSLKISNGKWHWFSHRIGGRGALDYLIKVKGVPFRDAIQILLGDSVLYDEPRRQTETKLILPEVAADTGGVYRYLTGRGISGDVVDYCVAHKLLYQTRQYANAMFVGYDNDETPRYACLRGTRSQYRGEVRGSDKRYAFSLAPEGSCTDLHIFEAAVDLLSYATLRLLDGEDWQEDALLSLGGVGGAGNGTVPLALQSYLDRHPQVETIRLHLDNDGAGRSATAGIMAALRDKHLVLDEPPAMGKDVNDELQIRMGLMRQ